MEKEFHFNINGSKKSVKVIPSTPLLWVIRDELGLKGTKFSCGKGLCGSCTIHINDVAYRSCIYPIGSLGKDAKVKTIEGLSKDEPSHPVLKAWKDIEVPQCGYCQPGQIMKASSLYKQNSQLDPQTAIRSMNILCRCGSYPEIKKAITKVFQKRES